MKFDRTVAEKYLNDLLKQYKIKVRAYSASSCGTAWFRSREIKIPAPTNLDRFGVCLHEVKHIIDGNKGKRYEQEFACDLYALNIFKELGYETQKWESRMRWHSLSRIAMAFNRGLSLRTINQEIRNFFAEVDFDKWVGQSVYVERVKNEPLGYTITYTLKLDKDEVEGYLNRKGLMLEKSIFDDSTYGKWVVKSNGDQYGIPFENLYEIINYYKLGA